MDIKQIIDNKKFSPDALKDQFFLVDENIILDLVDFGEVSNKDTVLEIGAGFGNITTDLGLSAKRVIAFEIDKRYKPFIKDLPENVDFRFQDAWDYIKRLKKGKNEFNKIVSSLPYSFCEKLMHALINISYEKAVLVVPLKFVNTINENGVFSSFFKAEILKIVEKESFYPIPRSNSAIINLIKIKNPILEKNLPIFLRQYVYLHQKQKVKNSLMEGLILFNKLANNKVLTKNEARDYIKKVNINDNYLVQIPKDITVYNEISVKFVN